ncbi:MAG TPA: hypothetical protein VM095_18935 [Pyrinomonadaceae bacterium]|nr:hypothetical protein [Pyrinomonadaceae bacterium]
MATKSKKASKAKKATASKPQALAKSAISQSAQRINFKIARVFPGIVPKTWFLVVEGTKPYLNMTVRLSPLIYTHRPDYWGIEVIGTLSGIGLPITAPYHVFISLEGIIGTKGIEVIGSTVRRKINIPGQGLVNQP